MTSTTSHLQTYWIDAAKDEEAGVRKKTSSTPLKTRIQYNKLLPYHFICNKILSGHQHPTGYTKMPTITHRRATKAGDYGASKPNTDGWISTPKACLRLGISHTTLYKWSTGRIDCHPGLPRPSYKKIAGRLFYEARGIDRLADWMLNKKGQLKPGSTFLPGSIFEGGCRCSFDPWTFPMRVNYRLKFNSVKGKNNVTN